MLSFNDVFKDGFIPTDEAKPLPEGLYQAIIKKAELKDNKSLTGVNLVLRLSVHGRSIYDYLCVEHPNPRAQHYAHRKLKDICEAIGLTEMTDTKQLKDQTVCVRLNVEIDVYATERGDGEKIYCNRIYSYHPIEVMGMTAEPVGYPISKAKPKRAAKPKTRKNYANEVNQLPKLIGNAVKRGVDIPLDDFDDSIPW
jgi:hypothetical protein